MLLKTIMSQVPVEEVKELAAQMIARGISQEGVVEQIAMMLDDLVDWKKVVGGPIGAMAEASDGPLLRAIVAVIVARVVQTASPGKKKDKS